MSNTATHTFTLDPFQEEAIKLLKDGLSVVVSAPTGSGKTVIAEFVIEEALKGKERVFYTTPLKALSNQKFHDFQNKFGEDKVGILTGDVAVNRDAQVVVMTTEIYRNMLYGTLFGTIDNELRHLRYVVLDECHYMNDPERGTVWEESIIYSPQSIQILALSATIANAKELSEWISNVHGTTNLVETFTRPVPLRFYYFKDSQLTPLLTTDKKLNPNLKEHKDSYKAMRQKFRDLKRLKHKKLVTVPDIVKSLNEKGLLPAIYFVFSRRGCELALKECQRLGFNLLTINERKILANLIQERIYRNEYLFRHKHLGFLYQGLAVHHAGLLPQWKAIVENLFSKGLIKAVFATETLAAGINMPAKTTIISNLSKRGDLGHKSLTSNEFLQMSGRAGRRGMDKIGNVVVKESQDHTAIFAAKLAASVPDPLTSQFTPNYSMALNLLQHHTQEEIKELLNKSFGQYLINKDIKKHSEEKELVENKLKTIDPIKAAGKQKKYESEIKEINKFIEEHKHFYWRQFLNIISALTKLGYLKDNVPNEKGLMAASLRGENILLIAEVLLNVDFVGALHGTPLQAHEFAACVSCLAIDELRSNSFSRFRPTLIVEEIILSMQKISKKLLRVQRENNIEIKTEINPLLSGLVKYWCNEDTRWEDLFKMTNLDEGDIIRALRRTIDLLRHIKNAPYLDPNICELAKYAIELVDKEPVREFV